MVLEKSWRLGPVVRGPSDNAVFNLYTKTQTFFLLAVALRGTLSITNQPPKNPKGPNCAGYGFFG